MLFNDNDEKPRKRSFYAFAKNYPVKNSRAIYAIGESREMRKKERVKKIVFSLSLVAFFVLSFVIVAISLSLSNREIASGNKGPSSSFDEQLSAIQMSEDALAGGITFDLFKTNLAASSANAVVIDLKKANGQITYNTEIKTANDINAAEKASADARNTISTLKSMGYKIIGRIYCYEDLIAASKIPTAAITEKDNVTIWLDDSAQNNGNPWLNPYSQAAEKYLLEIISESASIGADVILLESVSFPEGNYIGNAVCKGEAESEYSRNAILHNFIEKAAEKAGVPVAVAMNVDSALNGNTAAFAGSLFDSRASFNAIDFRKASQKDGYMLKDGAYSAADTSDENLLKIAMPMLIEKLNGNYNTKQVVPIISDEKSVSTLSEMGINNYIILP